MAIFYNEVTLNIFYCSDHDGEVELDDVWFAYPSRPSHPVLKVAVTFLFYVLALQIEW